MWATVFLAFLEAPRKLSEVAPCGKADVGPLIDIKVDSVAFPSGGKVRMDDDQGTPHAISMQPIASGKAWPKNVANMDLQGGVYPWFAITAENGPAPICGIYLLQHVRVYATRIEIFLCDALPPDDEQQVQTVAPANCVSQGQAELQIPRDILSERGLADIGDIYHPCEGDKCDDNPSSTPHFFYTFVSFPRGTETGFVVVRVLKAGCSPENLDISVTTEHSDERDCTTADSSQPVVDIVEVEMYSPNEQVCASQTSTSLQILSTWASSRSNTANSKSSENVYSEFGNSFAAQASQLTPTDIDNAWTCKYEDNTEHGCVIGLHLTSAASVCSIFLSMSTDVTKLPEHTIILHTCSQAISSTNGFENFCSPVHTVHFLSLIHI